MKESKFRRLTVIGLSLTLVLSSLLLGSCSDNSASEDSTADQEETVIITNPLTGETAEQGFDENAINQRIAAFVVENSPDARPQWGMTDENYSPDIVLQGEVEGGITRTLWFYADYNKLPEIIGPMRSARPPFIKFSELFDSIFIHWGQSSSKGEYVGAKTVFKKDKVDHINQMTFNDTMGLYDRDHTRSTAIEHRGILYGAKVAEAIAQEGFRTEPEDYTKLDFDSLGWLTALEKADYVSAKYSDRSSSQATYWTYNEEDQKYHTENFQNDFARDNLIILYDETEYITKYNYGGSGSSVTYCNYKLAGGKGMIFSKGAAKEIEWKVEDGKLVLIDTALTRLAQEKAEAAAAEDGSEGEDADAAESAESSEEAEPVVVNASLNVGKTWIGWISSNNGGNIAYSAAE